MQVNDPREWLDNAACAPRNLSEKNQGVDWYSSDSDEKFAARAICQGVCPVRRECLQDALNNKDIWGIHGGVDDYEVRRTLSVDSDGEPKIRKRAPRCPYCMSRRLEIAGSKTKKGYSTICNDCGLHWYMAVIPAKLKTRRAV